MTVKQKVIGRYAPSPTGALHLGNLRTALLAWLQVRSQGGVFLLRMEDLDLPRVVKGSDKQILHDLEWLGIDWDGEVVYQSQRTDLYQDALNRLSEMELTYPCFCSRKDIQQAASAPHVAPGVYPNVCRDLSKEQCEEKSLSKAPAIRCKVQGDLVNTCGDFVIKRADGLFAYQLAVVVDDLDQGVNQVLRGKDLYDSTPRQRYLASLLEPNKEEINYTHVPLMLDSEGVRLSKRDGSLSVSSYRSKGIAPDLLRGELVYGLGWIDQIQPISMDEIMKLVAEIDTGW